MVYRRKGGDGLKVHCSICNKVIPDTTAANGIKLENGKVLCWSCALNACDKSINKARSDVDGGPIV
jgi:hypothetical protein